MTGFSRSIASGEGFHYYRGTERNMDVKEEIERREADWKRKAQAEDLRCSICSELIPYPARETYLRTTLCGDCADRSTTD